MAGLAGPDRDADGQMSLAGARSEGDRLQQLRAVLPCEVRVVAETHPLFGRLLAAKSFKRWNGVLLLVIDLPDGSPGTIRCDATDVLGVGRAEAAVGAGCGGAAGAAPVGGAAGDACRSRRVGGGRASRFASSLIAVTTTGE